VLAPGEYVLELNDRSTIHNFHLRGRYAGADVTTDVAGTGETRAIVVLRDGESYIYACDAHPATMEVTFSIHDRIRTQN
jgi:plastocyanin